MRALIFALVLSGSLLSEARAASQHDSAALERLALARARSQLWHQVTALPLVDGTLGQSLAGSPAADRAIRLWVRAREPFRDFRQYSDGTVEVDLRLTGGELSARVSRAMDESVLPQRRLPSDMLVEQAARWPTLWVTAAAGPADPQSDAPRGWEDVTAAGVDLARRAATAAALDALLERAAQLQVSSTRRLSGFIDASTELRAALRGVLRSAARVRVDLDLDQTAVAEASIAISELVRILTEVHARHYAGEEFSEADFREMALLSGLERVEATGLAAPPDSEHLRSSTEPGARPAWAASVLTATGRFAAEGEPPDPHVAIALARLAAMEDLRRQVDALEVAPGLTLDSALRQHPALRDDVALFVASSREAGEPRVLADGALEVRLELPLERLLRITWQPATIQVDETAKPAAVDASQEDRE